MRSGGLLVQQELAADAAAVMRQALTLARRRGHAQVTPLHVAAAVLSDSDSAGGGGGLLRSACLRSRAAAASHPLRCKALELCFNVALNRLATAGGGPGPLSPAPAMFQFHHHHHHYAAAGAGHRAPALSNALAAAFKRAQANQRRGGSGGGGGGSAADGGGGGQGQGQQHVVPVPAAAKVELGQLVISILDDPSVSRVMREAGFCSAEVKANVEKAVSSSDQSSNTTAGSSTNTATASPNNTNTTTKGNKVAGGGGDAVRVLDCMTSPTNLNRCVVVLGESAAAAERVVKAVMDRVSKGGELLRRRHDHERLRNAQFVPFSAASFRGLPREEVEARAGELCALVRECCAACRPVVLVLQDLGYAAQAWAAASWKRSTRAHAHGLGGVDDYYYCPVEHAVMELGRLVRGGDRDMAFWMLGFGAYASYASCRSGQPSLETVLGLHPVVVPDGGLALSLAGDSEVTHCGADRGVAPAPAASVPSWIRRCQGPVVLTTGSELTLSFSSPASSSHRAFTHYYHDTNNSCVPWHDPMNQQRQPLLLNRRHDHGATMTAEPYDQLLPLANPNNPGSSNNSVSKSNSSGGTTTAPARRPKFTELTAENLKILCSALEARVPRHGDIAPGIASAVLQRRSGVTTTRTARPSPSTWLLFRGRDGDGKVAMARELARLVFGSYAEFTCITAGDHSTSGLKRQRSPENQHQGGGCMQMFYEAIRENPHRVVLIDGGGVEHGSEVEAGVVEAMATGTVRSCCDGGVASLEDSIVVVCCKVFESRSSTRVSSPPRPVKQQRITSDEIVDGEVEDDDGAGKGTDEPRRRFSLDLNACAAIDDQGEEEGSSSHNDDMGMLNAVDGVFFF